MRFPRLLPAAALGVALAAAASPVHAAAKLPRKYGVTLTSADHRQRGALVREIRGLITQANELAARSLSDSSPHPIADALQAGQVRTRARALLSRAKGEADYEITRTDAWAVHEQKKVDEARAQPRDEGTEALFRYKAYATSRTPAKSPPADRRRGFALSGAPVADFAERAVRDRYDVTKQGAVTMSESKLRADPYSQKMMNRWRPLQTYRDIFGNHIERMFGELSSNRTWLDVGAGEGVALAEYKQFGGSGKVMGVELEPSRTRIDTMIAGDIIDVQIPKRSQIRLITDVAGAMAYSARPDLVLQKYAKVLQRGGRAMIYMPGDGFNFVASRDGRRREDLMDYLDHVRGFKVERIRELGGDVAIILRRTSTPFRAPELEILQSGSAARGSTMQARVFRRTDRELGAR